MQVKISMIESEIRDALAVYIRNHYGISVESKDLDIEVKSKQNYRSEWEIASIRLEANARPSEG